MQDGQTIAAAEGNAAALLYTTITESPDDTPFDTVMTPEMIEKHKYYNDDILEIAEKIADKLRELEVSKEVLSQTEATIANARAEGVQLRRGGQLSAGLTLAIDQVKRAEMAIAMYEDQIRDEIDEVRAEYRRLAENLNSRAETFRGDYDGLLRFRDNELQEAMRMRRSLTEGGVDPEAATRMTQPATEDGYRSHYVERYAVTWGDYRLLQEGFAITTTREALSSIVWGAAELIALEIITGGLVTVAAGAVMTTRIGVKLAGAAARVGDNVLELLIKRYNALPQGAKTKLDEIFGRIKRGEERPTNNDGVTGKTDEAVGATPTCAARGVAFC